MNIPDCAVVGASVTGCTVARVLAENGRDVLLLSDKIGKEGKCTAIVSDAGLKRTGLNYAPAILNDVYGATFHSGRQHLAVKSPVVQARVLDRFKLDELAFAQAISEGARFKKQFVAKPPKARAVVGADGVASSTAKLFDFPPLEKTIVGYEAEFERAAVKDAGSVDVFLDFPGLFGWIVPVNEETVRVGLAVDRDLGLYKKRFFKLPEVSAALKKARKIREFTHAIPVRPRRVTQSCNVVLVGDAAGQTKATTGGGIVFGCSCAKIAAREICGYLDGGRLNYEKAWRKECGGFLKAHRAARKLLDWLPVESKPALLTTSKIVGLPWLFGNFGDMDYFLR